MMIASRTITRVSRRPAYKEVRMSISTRVPEVRGGDESTGHLHARRPGTTVNRDAETKRKRVNCSNPARDRYNDRPRTSPPFKGARCYHGNESRIY